MPDDFTPRGALDRPVPCADIDDTGDDPAFDEKLYLRAFPDVAEAVQRGYQKSALDHYLQFGKAERRLHRPVYQQMLGASLPGSIEPPRAPPAAPVHSIDVVVATRSGAIFVVGWVDDRYNPLIAVSIGLPDGVAHSWQRFPRLRRQDVEDAVKSSSYYHFGFWTFGDADTLPLRGDALARFGESTIELCFANGAAVNVTRPLIIQDDAQLRDTAMGYFAASGYNGDRTVEAFVNLDLDAGDALINFNKRIAGKTASRAAVQRFGPERSHYAASIIVALYGIADFFFLQSCLYAQGRDIEIYEFIYVVNSPELIEPLQREARIAQSIYGLSQTLVMLPGNAGFGAANNIGARYARSNRLLCVNPDVFPRDRDWARRHSDCVGNLPPEQTRLFGTSLYYDDGSLMHGGMYFASDTGVLVRPDSVTKRDVLRVEHHGKGAPPWARQFVASRQVSAVTGAFISIDRNWFETLGGFSEDYIFGHYEDADLCLKSLAKDSPVWMHDIPMWHLEGKGSTRLPPHEGGAMLNRWFFSRTWAPAVMPDLLGPSPERFGK